MIYERPNFLRSVMEIDIDARMCEAFPEEEVSGGGGGGSVCSYR